ncbi:acyl-CoA dehydrogenase family protein [Nocardia sp. NPDC057227]|uniref:acyl-CoA dehydrogenase family protein n=1 Tax=Nocardia sp. NPDC057227 TaxID=3346056 RepID=UPI0036437E08
MGCTASDLALDAQLRGALCDWAQIAAPRLLLVLTGDLDLAVGGILALGNGSDYQRECLAELDNGDSLGVLALTEFGGTNGANQGTIADYDRARNGFWLTTPSFEFAKFMPNIADPGVPKTVVVTARLLVDGRDEGVLPFLVRLRTDEGLIDGVDVETLPDKDSAPMDHAVFRFRRVWLPADALLSGDWGRMTDTGFDCDLPVHKRFHAAVSALGNGRLDLANASIASARAALTGLVNYVQQRRPAHSTPMADRHPVRSELISHLAAVYATSVLGRRLRDLRATADADEADQRLWSMLAKPLLSFTAQQTLTMVRQRMAAQGALRVNHVADWIGNTQAIYTAEGENQIMLVTAGKAGRALTALRLPELPAELPWYHPLLTRRQEMTADRVELLRRGAPGTAADAIDSIAIELAEATGAVQATTALLAAADGTADPVAKALLESAAAIYALETVKADAFWYAANQQLPPELAVRIDAELAGHHAVLAGHLEELVGAFLIVGLDGPVFAPDYRKAWQDRIGWSDTSFGEVGEAPAA